MPTDAHRLSGVRPITGRLAEELLSRPEGRSRPLPVVVGLGVRGSGKTALLDELSERCADLPHALVDFERRDWEHIQPRELLGHLAFELGRHWPQFGRIAFPRLWLCMLVLGSPVEVSDRRTAMRKLKELIAQNQPLERNKEAIGDVVDLVGGVTSGNQLPGWKEATDLLLRGLSWYDRRRLVGKVKTMPTGPGDQHDFLLGIAKQAQGDDEDRAAVDAIICDAFLADLRRAYSGLSGTRRTMNCLILLDNAHAPGGRAFLRALIESRRHFPDEADPLVVVATSRTWNPDWNESWSLATTHHGADLEHPRNPEHRTGDLIWPPPRRPADVEADWAAEHPESRWRPWYLLELGALSGAAVVDIAAEHDVHPTSRLPKFLSRLTDGHPGAVREILPAIADHYQSGRPNSLRNTLYTKVFAPDGSESTLLAEMYENLLQDFSTASRQELVTASAAAEAEMLFHKEILDLRNPMGEGPLFKQLADQLWLRVDPDDDSRYRLHPWLRRLLLRKLAARAEDHPLSWDRVHTRCRDFYDRTDRVADARYHDLALGNVPAVITHLSARLGTQPAEFDLSAAQSWLDQLDTITAAPNRLVQDVDPYAQVQQYVGEWPEEQETTLAWLVVSLWLSRDPLGDPGGTLNSTIESSFHHLAQGRGRGSMLLHERAEYYR
ncbi:hypothetical protein [Amycolatopsis panacis]|uniref:Uncharacterized protein n=1 Tax=Amycolatopsis panacis TaxID=2340917 RepID=A0A419I8R0_9PSEU|nr:hypothetical protein [Amycolatopsis panacis]RJQ88588.1 hypothetical protein D5S19_06470 [Amycolatopsis panacis]